MSTVTVWMNGSWKSQQHILDAVYAANDDDFLVNIPLHETCPFCGETGFDEYGLQLHLLTSGWCEVFGNVKDPSAQQQNALNQDVPE